MAILGSNYDMMQTPTQWGQYIPDPMDYRTTPEYQAAMDAYNQAYAQTPAGQPAGQAPGYDEASGMHYAGSQRMADMTAGQYQADLLNHRMMQAAAGGPDSANYKQFLLAMNSRAGVRPDESGLAYNAMNPDGSQILSPALAALLERLGIGPAAVPGFEGGPNGLPIQSLGDKTPAPTSGNYVGGPNVPDPTQLGGKQQGATQEIDNRRGAPEMGNSLGGGFVGPQQGGGGGFSLPGGGVPPELFAAFMQRLKQQMGGGQQQPPMNSAQPNPAAYGYNVTR